VDNDLLKYFPKGGKESLGQKVLNEAKKGNFSVIKMPTTDRTIHVSDNLPIFIKQKPQEIQKIEKHINTGF